MTQSFTSISDHALVADDTTTFHQVRSSTLTRVSRWSLILITVVTAAASLQVKWSLAKEFSWQCDEIPMFRRFTGAGAYVTNEAEAVRYKPSLYHARCGAIRSLRPPSSQSTIHTSTGFWVNLTTQLFGVSPLAARLMPMFWSMVAIVVAGLAGYWLTKSVIAGSVAAMVVCVSPHAIIFGAQARGYAESMALSPLLIISIEWLRRRPLSRRRALFVAMVAIQLSLTVYTAWVYWTLPILVLSVLMLPKNSISTKNTKRSNSYMLLITFILVGFMCLYTLGRWKSLFFSASHMGVPVHGIRDFVDFSTATLSQMFGHGYLLFLPFLLLGIFTHRQSSDAWWLVALALSAAVAMLFVLLNGSAGYPRNFGLWLVPLAVLVGLGFHRGLVNIQRIVPTNIVALGVPILLAIISILAFPRTSAQAHAAIYPDWGGMVQRLNDTPETVGPRWVARCLTNHWQIDWYQPISKLDRILAIPEGKTIEVLAGFQYDLQHQEISYQQDNKQKAIVPRPIPPFLASIAATDIRGVAVRRWVGVKEEISNLQDSDPEKKVFMTIKANSQLMHRAMLRIETLGPTILRNVVFFAHSQTAGGAIATLITTEDIAARLAHLLQTEHFKRLTIQVFTLTPLEG